jgi:hypothetical protein
MKIPLLLPLELIDLICKKINLDLLKKLCVDPENPKDKNIGEMYLITPPGEFMGFGQISVEGGIEKISFLSPFSETLYNLNRNRIEKYWRGIGLVTLIENGDLYGSKYLIVRGNIYWEKAVENIIMKTANRGDLKKMKFLAENWPKGLGFDITVKNNLALIYACKKGKIELVKYLISKGCDITAQENYAVINASENGRLNVVKYLVSLGADITDRNNLALRCACANGHLQTVKYLISVGADIHAENDEPIVRASSEGYLNVVKYLVSQGADITAQDNQALTEARIYGKTNTVKYIEKLSKMIKNN